MMQVCTYVRTYIPTYVNVRVSIAESACIKAWPSIRHTEIHIS